MIWPNEPETDKSKFGQTNPTQRKLVRHQGLHALRWLYQITLQGSSSTN